MSICRPPGDANLSISLQEDRPQNTKDPVLHQRPNIHSTLQNILLIARVASVVARNIFMSSSYLLLLLLLPSLISHSRSTASTFLLPLLSSTNSYLSTPNIPISSSLGRDDKPAASWCSLINSSSYPCHTSHHQSALDTMPSNRARYPQHYSITMLWSLLLSTTPFS